MIRKIDHIGIAVSSLDERLPFWTEGLGLRLVGVETVEREQVRAAFLAAGGPTVELLEPTAVDSTIGAFVARRGEGIHHLTFEVTDLESLLGRLSARGVALAGEAPRRGAGGRSVAFVHPGSTGGVLVELVQGREAPGVEADLQPGRPALAYLREPQEKLWGLVRRLDPAGVVLEGVDLGSFDDWLAQLERADEGLLGPSVLFVPMSRVEKLLLDRRSGELPSLAERFERRLGAPVDEVFARLARSGS